jgi:hypothetical protein
MIGTTIFFLSESYRRCGGGAKLVCKKSNIETVLSRCMQDNTEFPGREGGLGAATKVVEADANGRHQRSSLGG